MIWICVRIGHICRFQADSSAVLSSITLSKELKSTSVPCSRSQIIGTSVRRELWRQSREAKFVMFLSLLMLSMSACLTVEPQVVVDLTPDVGTTTDEIAANYATTDPSVEERVVAALNAEEFANAVNQVLGSEVPASTKRENPDGWRNYTPHRYIDRTCEELFSNNNDAREERLLHQSQLRSQIEEALDTDLRGSYPTGRFYEFADEFCNRWFELAFRG